MHNKKKRDSVVGKKGQQQTQPRKNKKKGFRFSEISKGTRDRGGFPGSDRSGRARKLEKAFKYRTLRFVIYGRCFSGARPAPAESCRKQRRTPVHLSSEAPDDLSATADPPHTPPPRSGERTFNLKHRINYKIYEPLPTTRNGGGFNMATRITSLRAHFPSPAYELSLLLQLELNLRTNPDGDGMKDCPETDRSGNSRIEREWHARRRKVKVD